MTKCAKCRRPTEWLLTQNRNIVCKLCSARAPTTLKAYKCKHRFMNGTVFSKSCNRGCGVSLKISDDDLAAQNEAAQRQLNQYIAAGEVFGDKNTDEVQPFQDLVKNAYKDQNVTIKFDD